MNRESNGSSNIWVASSDGKLDLVKKYVEESGMDINIADEFGYTPLLAAVCYDHLDLVQYLISQGANVNQGDEDQDTALHLCESIQCADILLKANADVNALNVEGKSPLVTAMEEEKEILIGYFLTQGCKAEGLNCEVETTITEDDPAPAEPRCEPIPEQ